MLKTIRRIIQKVSAASSFDEALQIMVRDIRQAMATEACTVFLVDRAHQEYVLAATDGLNAASVGTVRLKMNQGLVGLVGQREEPINLEDAPTHPNFSYQPQAGEERYRAFLGVPIIHQRVLLGILIVQQAQQRRFDESEEAFLITMSAQLAGVIAHAQATRNMDNLFAQASDESSFLLTGIPSAQGVGIGTAVVIYPLADLEAVPDRKTTDIADEITLFSEALEATQADIKTLEAKLSNLSEEERVLFDAYLRILEQTSLGAEVIKEIRKGNWAQGALRTVILRHVRIFESLEDDYLRERATDIKDLGRRVLAHLQATHSVARGYPLNTVLIGEDLTAASLADVPTGCLVGIVSARGSRNSHLAILARAMGIPAVMGVNGLSLTRLDQREVIVDGYNGFFYVAPTAEIRQEFEALQQQQRRLDANLVELRDKPAMTRDGYVMAFYVNVGLAADAGLSLNCGAEGIGLYRTEIPFMVRDRFPAEEEQRVAYQQILKSFFPRPVVMRTLDIGGDKALPYFPVQEENPFLGWRGIRISLDHPEVFLLQVRAMLRASEGLDNLRILLPMISGVTEFEEASHLIWQAYQELLDEGLNIVTPAIGVMIEVPSAVYQADALASQADFLSVGSNDLIQYLLAVDRNNARVASLYDSLHPAVLRALMQVVSAAKRAGKPVSICGEMSGDPAAVILLLAMGFDALSMNASSLLRMKWVIRHFSLEEAQSILNRVLSFERPLESREYLENILTQVGLSELLHNKRF